MTIFLDCNTVEVVNPTLPVVVLDGPGATLIEVPAPSFVVKALHPPMPHWVYGSLPDSVIPVLVVPGPPGPGGGGGVAELYDTNTPNPPGAPFPYLRFERDIDGDVQAVYLGTAT